MRRDIVSIQLWILTKENFMFNFFKKKEEPKEEVKSSFFDDYSEIANRTQLTPLQKLDLLRFSIQKSAPITIAQDSSDNYGGLKTENYEHVPDVIFSHFAKQGFIGFPACAILKQNWIINNACSIPPQDAIRPGYKLTSREETTKQEDVEIIERISKTKYHILDLASKAVEKKKVFGSCLVVPLFSNDYDYSVPFNPDSVRNNTYRGMVVIEPWSLSFDFDAESLNNPMSQDFYSPTWFKLPNGLRIHKSHCIFLRNTTVPDILKPTYYYGGIPLTQMIYQRVYCAEKVANEAPMLALSKRLLVADIPYQQFKTNRGKIEENLNAITYMRDNFGILTKRPDAQIQQIDTSLSDFDSLILTQYQLVAAIAQMPATKLLKAQPTGLNATGEYDFKDYIQTLQTIQDNDIKPIIDRHNQLLSLSLFGKDMQLITTFNPIDTPSKIEIAQSNGSKAQTLATLIGSGVISQEEAREALRSDEDNDFTALQDIPEAPSDDEQNEVEELLKKLGGSKNEKETNNA